MRVSRILKQFNWRFLLVRILVNALALAITAALVPKIYFVDKTIWNLLLMALMLGVLNALLKPILQLLTLQFIFVTFGLVVVLMNALLLRLLAVIFPDRFAAQNLLWLLVGGLVLGLIGSFLESLLGLTMPIVPEEEAALRRQLEEQARHVDWHAVARRDAVPEEQAPSEAELGEPAAAESTVAEPALPGLDKGAGPPVEVNVDPVDPVAMPRTEAAISAEAAASAEPETAPEPREDQEEDRS
jgi:putative membrane protein